MEQIKRITLFKHEAALLLPSFLYSFNIATSNAGTPI
jgi:hypothetical protein